jgi:hypothetical protein
VLLSVEIRGKKMFGGAGASPAAGAPGDSWASAGEIELTSIAMRIKIDRILRFMMFLL